LFGATLPELQLLFIGKSKPIFFSNQLVLDVYFGSRLVTEDSLPLLASFSHDLIHKFAVLYLLMLLVELLQLCSALETRLLHKLLLVIRLTQTQIAILVNSYMSLSCLSVCPRSLIFR
jgi:hypothetical protein